MHSEQARSKTHFAGINGRLRKVNQIDIQKVNQDCSNDIESPTYPRVYKCQGNC